MAITTEILGGGGGGRDVIAAGARPMDGCACAALFWVFLPCWVGLQRTAPAEDDDGEAQLESLLRRRTSRRGPITIDADRRRRSVVRRILDDDGANEIRKLLVADRRRLQQQQEVSRDDVGRQHACYCGMPTLDSDGRVCSNAFNRPPFIADADDRTLALIKPDVLQYRKQIEDLIVAHGFIIVEERVIQLTKEQAGLFYSQDEEEPFYEALKEYISSGPLVALVLAKQNAVEAWRQLIGDKTDAFKSDNQTLRSIFGHDLVHTGLHGSDSYLSAECEIRFFFPEVSFDQSLADDIAQVDIRAADADKLCAIPHYPTVLMYDWVKGDD